MPKKSKAMIWAGKPAIIATPKILLTYGKFLEEFYVGRGVKREVAAKLKTDHLIEARYLIEVFFRGQKWVVVAESGVERS